MGMFDTIVCDFDLPFEDANGFSYQTKDLENYLDNYYIDSEGQLWKYNGGAEKDKYSYTGTLCFYQFEPCKQIRWLEFKAKVKKGIVEKVILSKLEYY